MVFSSGTRMALDTFCIGYSGIPDICKFINRYNQQAGKGTVAALPGKSSCKSVDQYCSGSVCGYYFAPSGSCSTGCNLPNTLSSQFFEEKFAGVDNSLSNGVQQSEFITGIFENDDHTHCFGSFHNSRCAFN